MTTDYPIVVYGASGYTGRLTIEFLREYSIPFIAAGRSKSRIEEALKYIPGIESADYQIVEVEHTEESLVELLTGKKVVCNTVGPFARVGETVVAAALKAGCHYIDTTGEQDWMLSMAEKYGKAYEAAGLVCSPATAYMFTVSDIAARVCLETPGVDSLDIRIYCQGTPTVASTQSVFDMVRNDSYKIADRELVKYQGIEYKDIMIPGSGDIVRGTQWGGGSHVAFFQNDARVRNCNLILAMANQNIWKGIEELEKAYKVQLQWLSDEQLIPVLNKLAGDIQSTMPARENRHFNRFVDWCYGRGNNVAVSCQITGNSSYQLTGLLQAYAATSLVQGTPKATGFRSICEVLGHRELFGALQSYGYVNMKETVLG